MRLPLIAGNWKMNGSRASVNALVRGILDGVESFEGVEVAVFPPYVFLGQVEQLLAASSIKWGAQNVCAEAQGAFTGEISAAMLLDFGCRYALVGHSERRQLFGEDNMLVAAKFVQASKSGLHPILCVGETLAERDTGLTEQIIKQQLEAVLMLPEGLKALTDAVIAYEPVWAIGTGITATPDQAQAVHTFIRKTVAKFAENIAQRLRIIYGGSIKANIASALFNMPDIDGGLVGGASLDPQEFINIVIAAKGTTNVQL